jgi:transcriptional regulator with XRE-family HTH domain
LGTSLSSETAHVDDRALGGFGHRETNAHYHRNIQRLLGVQFRGTAMKSQLSQALRLVRVYHDQTQTETARRIGLSKSYVSELEAGNKKVTLDVLEKYASAFKIPISSLMLFAEHSHDGKFREDVRVYIADKVVKMLDWIATISEDGQQEKLHHD